MCRSGGVAHRGAQLAVAVAAAAPDAADELEQLVVGGAGAQRAAQVHALRGEQAGVERAVGRDARARAVAAERLRDRRDEADFARAVFECVALGDFAAVVAVARRDRPARVDARREFARRHHQRGIPVIARADVHVFDEAHDDAGAAEMRQQIEQRVIVDAALHDGVHLDGRETRAPRVFDAVEHFGHAAEAAAHLREDIRIERVETHGDALEAGGLELGGVLGQQHAVGGERDVLDAGQRGEIADEIREIRPQQRLAAGDAQLLHAGAHEHAREPQDLGEVEPLVRFQEPVRLVKGLARHAIRAAEIAAIHDRDAQVVDGPAQRVDGNARAAEGSERNDLVARCPWRCYQR